MAIETDAPETPNAVLRRGLKLLSDRLPKGWVTSEGNNEAAALGERGADLVLRVSSPDGVGAWLVFEAKRGLERRDISSVTDQLNSVTSSLPNAWGVVVARYLAPSVRKSLEEQGLSYIDATGNMRVVVSSPGLYVSDQGADKDPWRGPGRPRGTLKGVPAAKIVRALVDLVGPWTIRELISASGASTGATYRVLEYLQREDLIRRNDAGMLFAPSWRGLLEQWSKDSGFMRNNRVTRYVEPRGLNALLKKASAGDEVRYAVTGTIAAAQWAAYAPARSAMIYVADAAQAADAWGLRPAEAGANILLAEPEVEVVFDRTLTTSEGIVIAAPAQVVVDLMTGPGRNPSEAEELMEWMGRNESSWQR